MTPEEYKVLIAKKKPPKYRNKRTIVDGITFDSKGEANRYCQLKLLKRAGEIVRFELQPRFVLQEAFTKDGVHHRAIVYVADFLVEYPDGHIEIEDYKGMRTEVYKLKLKLFEAKYPELMIKEVRG